MDTNKKVISSIIFAICVLTAVSCQGSCPTYSCGSLKDGQCSFKNATDTYTSFVFQQCKAGQYCPYNQLIGDDSSCLVTPKPKYYPGSNCTDNTDCLSNSCEGAICKGTANGEKCVKKDECLIGSACLKNGTETTSPFICQAQLTEGKTCECDLDCQNHLGCSSNGNCTKYFSLVDGTNSTSANLCESGFMHNGICKTLTNVNPIDATCDADCLYTDKAKNNVTLADSCKCGYNKDDKKYCTLGSSHDYYKNYVSYFKKLLVDTKDCHTAERASPICLERLRKDKSLAFRKTVQSFGNNQVFAKNFPILANADSCVKFVAFSGYNEDPIRPDKYQCAKFSCDKQGANCLHSVNPFNDDGSNITVALTRVCNNTQSCSAGPLGLSQIYNDAEVNGKCVDNTPILPKFLRYPGEACNADKDICFNDVITNGTCTEGKCAGVAQGGNCTSTEQCLVGNFCDVKNGNSTCVKQIAEGKNCTEAWDCQNNLFCYNGLCKAFGSLKTGDEVSKNTIGSFAANSNKDLTCETTTLNVGNGTLCAQYKYENTTDSKKDAEGFVPCNWGDDCVYTDGIDKFSQKCGCGYNAEGQGYCPISQLQRKFIYLTLWDLF
jgi:hypothetical protein